MPFKVAIIGAGPAGSALGKMLVDAGISVSIFEAKSTQRVDGGSLDLHPDTGIAALKKAGLYKEFLKHARFDGESIQITDKRLEHLVDQRGGTEKKSNGRPEIDRPKLIQILNESLPTDTIKWGYKLKHIDEDDNDKELTLHFENAPSEGGFDLIVGADGAWSKVRRSFTDAQQPYYSGVAGYHGSIPDAEANANDVYKLVRRGSVMAFSNYSSISGQQMGDGQITVATWFRTANAQPPTPYADGDGDGSARAYIQEKYADWNPQLLNMPLNPKAGNYVWRPLYMLPVGHRWTHRPGLTLIGDAAHLMTPFAGEGVNLALTDSMKLAAAIVKASQQQQQQEEEDHVVGATATAMARREALSRHVQQFEQDMFQRAGKVQQLTVDMMNCMFNTPGAPWSSISEYLTAVLGNSTSKLLYPLLWAGVHSTFFCIKRLRAPSKKEGTLKWDLAHPPPPLSISLPNGQDEGEKLQQD